MGHMFDNLLMLPLTWLILFTAFCLLIAKNDFINRKVNNRLLLVALAAQLIWLLLNQFGVSVMVFAHIGWSQALTGFVMGLLVFFPLWMLKLLGAGDVKLIATLGFLLGFAGLWQVVLAATVLTGLHAVITILAKGWLTARTGWWQESKETRRGVPYGAYLALTALAWALWYYWSGHAWF